jgi:hypothetical protein
MIEPRLLTGPAVTYPEVHTTVAHWVASDPVPFHALPNRLKGMGTTVIYISPQKQLFHLAGPEGVSLATQMLGDKQ